MQYLRRRVLVSFFLFAFTSMGCSDDGPGTNYPPGPYDDIPPTTTLRGSGLTAPVDVVRDKYGVPHIYARKIADAAFANGYVMAVDRMPQMDLFRHMAAGRVSELFGALDKGQIDGDISRRIHRMRPVAEEAWAMLEASTDPIDAEIVLYLTRYSDGVNQYLDELRAGKHTIDPAVSVFFDPSRVKPWSPVDSLTIGRFQTWALSYQDFDVRISAALDRAKEVFDPKSANPHLARRAKAAADLIQIRPLDHTPTIDGFPNVETDTGTRAKPQPARAQPTRPRAPRPLYEAALRALAAGRTGPLFVPGERNGSNNWVVGPSLTGGKTMLANDPHLPLSNPSIWYLIHITVPDLVDVQGVSFPGLPAVQLGHNAHIAWGATVVLHDVSDFYLEEIVPCSSGGGDCVKWKNQEVRIETVTEELRVGALGTITETRQVTWEVVPHHGPIIPVIENHQIVPRTGKWAISARYTGHEVTNEVRALYRIARARTVEEAFAALEDWHHGAMNWVIVDDQGNIGWTTMARIPWRSPSCFSYDPLTNPDGVAPYLVLPGDGSCEWEGWMDARYVPHAINPAQGFIATANADPIGATFSGSITDEPFVDGRPLYVGALYDVGYRVGRITRRLQGYADAGQTITLDEMASVQGDVYSNYGAAMRPHLVAAVAKLDEERATPGTHPDLTAWAAALPQARYDRLDAAAARLEGWTFDTPAAVEGSPGAAEIADSSATTIFNVWAVYFLDMAFGDELRRVDDWVDDQMTSRVALQVFERPGELASGIAPETGEAVLCDDLDTPAAVESCTLMALIALDQALTWLESVDGFGSADMDQWRWGKLHTLTLRALIPDKSLNVPPEDDPNPLLREGFPRPGDQFSVDSSNNGYTDFDFSYGHGPSMRHLTEFEPGQPPRTRIAVPGGAVYDRASPHYRDLVDEYWRHNRYFDLPWLVDQIKANVEARTLIRP